MRKERAGRKAILKPAVWADTRIRASEGCPWHPLGEGGTFIWAAVTAGPRAHFLGIAGAQCLRTHCFRVMLCYTRPSVAFSTVGLIMLEDS